MTVLLVVYVHAAGPAVSKLKFGSHWLPLHLHVHRTVCLYACVYIVGAMRYWRLYRGGRINLQRWYYAIAVLVGWRGNQPFGAVSAR
jgi:hypothetical protein